MFKTPNKYILIALALLVPYIILCFYAHPIADDYSYANETLARGYLQSQVYEFLHWNGRYTCNVFVLATPLVWHSFMGYRLVAFAFILLTPLSAFFFISSLWHKTFSFSQKFLASLIFGALLLGMLPSLSQGIYWLTGAECYQLGSITAMFYAGLVSRYLQKHFIIGKRLHFMLCVLVLFIAIGFNEVLMLILLAAHGLLWLSLKKKDKFHSPLLCLAVFTLLFSLIMLLAPGNSIRSSFFIQHHILFKSLGMTALQMVRFFTSWVFYAPLLLASFLFISIDSTLLNTSPLFQRLSNIKLWQAFGLLWLIIFLCVFPAYWSMGILGQHRTLNVACFMFIPAWLLFVHVLCKRLNIVFKPTSLHKKIRQIVFLFMAACLLFSGNSGRVLMESADGEIMGFNKEMNARYARIETAKKQGEKEVNLPAILNRPESLFVFDIQPGCNNWINKCYALYFGIDKVCLDNALTQH